MFLTSSSARRIVAPVLAMLILVLCRGGTASPERGSVTGQVLDHAGNPVADAVVFARGELAATVTDAAGRFTLTNLPAGAHTVHVIPPGLYPIWEGATPGAGDSTRVVLSQEASPRHIPASPTPRRRGSRAAAYSGPVGIVLGTVTDSLGAGLPFANVLIPSTSLGAATDASGAFRIDGVPADSQTVRVLHLGYHAEERRVHLSPNQTLTLAFRLTAGVPATLETVTVTAKKEIIRRESSASFHSVGQESLQKLPVDTFQEAAPLKSGLHVQGGRGSAASVNHPAPGAAAVAPVRGFTRDRYLPNSVGGSAPVNGAPFDARFFRSYGVNPFLDPLDDPLATFAMDVDRASYCMARSYVREGHLPPQESVRLEEFVNALHHDYDAVDSDRDLFRADVRVVPSPFRDNRWILRVGLKAREVDRKNRAPLRLTLVVDVSGSMNEGRRLESVKYGLERLLDQLDSRDQVALVVYSGEAQLVLPSTPMREAPRVRAEINALVPNGSTNAEAGLVLGYDLADAAFDSGSVNRVVLCSDGVANVGVTDAGGILGRIRERARDGIELTTVGFGIRNYNDVLLERLADDGDGSYYYVDTPEEAEEVFVRGFLSTLYTVAREAKVQVDFDPRVVRGYRQLGYENRWLQAEDFRDDSVDAGEVGSGHEVTALFELKLQPGQRGRDLATVRLRYENPRTRTIEEREFTVSGRDVRSSWKGADPGFQLDIAVAELAEILRGSYWSRDTRLDSVLGLAFNAAWEGGNPPELGDVLDLVHGTYRLWPESGAERRWGRGEE